MLESTRALGPTKSHAKPYVIPAKRGPGRTSEALDTLLAPRLCLNLRQVHDELQLPSLSHKRWVPRQALVDSYLRIDEAFDTLLSGYACESECLNDHYIYRCGGPGQFGEQLAPYVYEKNRLTVAGERTPMTILTVGRQRYIASTEPSLVDRDLTPATYLNAIWCHDVRTVLSLVCSDAWWPRPGESLQHGVFNVRHTSMMDPDVLGHGAPDPDFGLHRYRLTLAGETRDLTVGIHTGWADAMPLRGDLLRNMQERMRLHDPDGLLVVNCKAGVGRTGTFILFDALQQQLATAGDRPEAFLVDALIQMRSQRPFMVQTLQQFLSVCDLAQGVPRGGTGSRRHQAPRKLRWGATLTLAGAVAARRSSLK